MTTTTTAATGSNMRRPLSKHVKARRADERDAEVGRRVRARRLEKQLSQTELATAIGVTFQQVQKYEKGVNRIGAGRLARIAEALEVPVTFFYDAQSPKNAGKTQEGSVLGLINTGGAMRLLTAFHKITNRTSRQSLIQMAESLAG